MKKKGLGLNVICWMLILAFGLALAGCGASTHDIKRIEALAQQALDNSEAAKASCAADAEKAHNAAVQAVEASDRADSAAAAAEQSAEKAESMANKAEDIFMQKMKK
ncbi:MAG: hypothetical protein R6U27_15785 [Desulfobacterales bacterium]